MLTTRLSPGVDLGVLRRPCTRLSHLEEQLGSHIGNFPPIRIIRSTTRVQPGWSEPWTPKEVRECLGMSWGSDARKGGSEDWYLAAPLFSAPKRRARGSVETGRAERVVPTGRGSEARRQGSCPCAEL